MKPTVEKPLFMRMEEEIEFSQMSPEQQQIYMRSLNNYRTFLATKDYDYKCGYEEGYAEGRAEVRAEVRVNTARLMIANGAPEDLILSALRLSKEDL